MELKRVGRREFLINTTKHLVVGEFYLTNRGMDEYKVTIEAVREDIKAVNVTPMTERPSLSEYGCGCIKKDGKQLCPTHGRY